jgi:hypothetical protein
MSASKRKKISDTLLTLVAERDGGSICPSEVARELFSEADWRSEMDLVRDVAQHLIDRGMIEATQKGKKIPNVLEAHGPIRLRKSS